MPARVLRLSPLRALRTAPLLALGLVALLAAGCDGSGADADAFGPDLMGRFQARDRYQPLAEALAEASLDGTLRDGGPFTVLAPTRIAFEYVGSDLRPVLVADAGGETLSRVLRHHVVVGRLAPEDFVDGTTLTAIDGTTLHVRRVGPVVTVDGVTLDVTDPTEASNGVAYPLADLLLDVLTAAERVRLSPLLSVFSQSAQRTGVGAAADALPAVTLLAPTNDAFAGLGPSQALLLSNTDVLQRALRAHVLPGDIDLSARAGQTVTTLAGDRLDVRLDNGVLSVAGLRVIREERTADGRLYVLGTPVLTTLSLGERVRVDFDLQRYQADIERAPAVAARLTDRSAALTVFAPSNLAYNSRLPAVTSALALAENDALRGRIAAAHVVVGRYERADLVDGLVLTAVDGTELRVQRSGDTILLDGRAINGGPEAAANGLLYEFSGFVLPNVDLLDTLLLRNYVAYAAAVKRAGLATAFRTTVRTAFAIPDTVFAASPGLSTSPTLPALLRHTATAELIGTLGSVSFTNLDGSARTIAVVSCTVTRGNPCSPFVLDSGVQVYQGGTTRSGMQAYHSLRSVDRPPALRAVPGSASSLPRRTG